MMKSYKSIQLVIIVLFSLGLPLNMTAQSAHCKDENVKKYALLVRNSEHMGAALKTASQMVESGTHYEAFEVVICGKEVMKLANKENKQLSGMLQQAQDLKVSFSVCGMSLNKFNISPEELPDQFEVVNNGLIRIFELQENCYYTLEL